LEAKTDYYIWRLFIDFQIKFFIDQELEVPNLVKESVLRHLHQHIYKNRNVYGIAWLQLILKYLIPP
jgi:hypothetical protein